MEASPQSSPRQPDPNRPRTYGLPRLPREYYQGDAVVHWSLPVFDRATGWLSDSFHALFRELVLHTAAREGLLCPVYCLMPDHLHLIWMGLRLDTDQFNGMAFLRTYLEPALAPARFQPQAHDHVLRSEQRRKNAFAEACRYDLSNPVRAGLVTRPEAWKFNGAVVPGYPNLHPTEADYWPKFWQLLARARHPDAGSIVRPPFNVGSGPKPLDDTPV
jgi:putative transposase